MDVHGSRTVFLALQVLLRDTGLIDYEIIAPIWILCTIIHIMNQVLKVCTL